MKEFTKEEISLCKQIAEKHRKVLRYGDWWKGKGEDVFLMNTLGGKLYPENQHKDIIPLWTISDCLEFLKERYDDVNLGGIQSKWEVQIYDAYDKVRHPKYLEDVRGKTPSEALLKAVLAVVEEK